jgi:hypothetical protein
MKAVGRERILDRTIMKTPNIVITKTANRTYPVGETPPAPRDDSNGEIRSPDTMNAITSMIGGRSFSFPASDCFSTTECASSGVISSALTAEGSEMANPTMNENTKTIPMETGSSRRLKLVRFS